MLNPTPPEARDADERLYWTGIVLAQAKPDDAIVLLGRDRIVEAQARLQGRLGRREAFWQWLTDRWRGRP